MFPSKISPSLRFGISPQQRAALQATDQALFAQSLKGQSLRELACRLADNKSDVGRCELLIRALIEKLGEYPLRNLDPKEGGGFYGRSELDGILPILARAYPGNEEIPESLFDAYRAAVARSPLNS